MLYRDCFSTLLKTKYMVVSSRQNVGQNHNLLIVSKSFENVVKFK